MDGPKRPGSRSGGRSAPRRPEQAARKSSSPACTRRACWSAPGTAPGTPARSPATPSPWPATRPAPGDPVWFGGGKLAADLSLPKLRARWDGANAPAQPRAHFTAEERNAIWEHAARTAHDARERIRRCAATDPAAAADAAWAASDTLHAAAAALGSRVIRQAADSYARAARVPYARIPRRTPAGTGLRQAARLLSRAALTGQLPALAQAQLVTQLAALVEAVIELRQAQQHAAQAAAARRAAEHLHAERRRLNRRTESRATRSARLADADFPVTPWAASPRERRTAARLDRAESIARPHVVPAARPHPVTTPRQRPPARGQPRRSERGDMTCRPTRSSR